MEQDGKYIALTNDIGKIKAVAVISGTKITSDTTMVPEIQVDSSLVVSPTEASINTFQAGQFVYQGSSGLVQASATVTSYDSVKQILVLENLAGEFRTERTFYNSFGIVANVLLKVNPSSTWKLV